MVIFTPTFQHFFTKGNTRSFNARVTHFNVNTTIIHYVNEDVFETTIHLRKRELKSSVFITIFKRFKIYVKTCDIEKVMRRQLNLANMGGFVIMINKYQN